MSVGMVFYGEKKEKVGKGRQCCCILTPKLVELSFEIRSRVDFVGPLVGSQIVSSQPLARLEIYRMDVARWILMNRCDPYEIHERCERTGSNPQRAESVLS